MVVGESDFTFIFSTKMLLWWCARSGLTFTPGSVEPLPFYPFMSLLSMVSGRRVTSDPLSDVWVKIMVACPSMVPV